MEIAYLITAYNNFEHLQRLIRSLNGPHTTFYIHVDKKSNFLEKDFDFLNVHFIERIPVSWGGWSHQQAILNLMKVAHKKEYERYVLLSEADYPIKSNNELHKKLKCDVEYLNLIKGFHPHKPEERIKYIYFEGFDRRNKNSLRTKLFTSLERLLRKIYSKKKYPFTQIYHGTTWWALSNNAVDYILTFIKKHKNYVKFFKSSWCPEESFIPTILGNSTFNEKCVGNLTYSDWSSKPAPAMITEKHITLLKNTVSFKSPYGTYEPFFARKFNDQSTELIDKIDRELRN